MSGFEYSIITEIKKSDKSNVYLASVEGHEYPVIVKEIRHGNIQVFEALKEIDSDYLPRIYHVEEIEDGLLVVEEYVDGELLADHLVLCKMTEEECLDIAEQVCDALEVLHSHEPILIHRDIKPSNLIVTPNGKVKLIDYDSSRLYKEESEGDTRLLGTEKYAPPEQYGFSQTDCRSDIYSLGVVFEKFTDFFPQNKQKLWKQLVERCTLFSPDSRYQSVAEVKHKIERIRKRGWTKYKIGAVVSVILIAMIAPILIYVYVHRNSESIPIIQSTTNATVGHTSEIFTTESYTTEEPTTEEPTTEEPTTEEPTTEEPITEEPTPEVINIDELDITSYKELKFGGHYWPTGPYDVKSTDTPEMVTLKEHIRDTEAMVLYHFRNKMRNRDFICQVIDLGVEPVDFAGIRLTSTIDGNTWDIPNTVYEVIEDVIIISNEYMNKLEDGFYKLTAILSQGNNQGYGVSTYVYVSDYEEIDEWFIYQNSHYTYKRGSNQSIRVVLRNYVDYSLISSASSIISGPNTIYEGYYFKMHPYKWLGYGNRVLEISGDFLESLREYEDISIFINNTASLAMSICVEFVD